MRYAMIELALLAANLLPMPQVNTFQQWGPTATGAATACR